MTDGQWLVELKRIESDYNEKRWKFRNKFKRYIRCNPFSNNYNEDELIKDLQEISKLRQQMKELSKNNNFRNDHSESYRINNDDLFFKASNPTW